MGWAITVDIPVKFSTEHGRSRPEVGSTKHIDVYGSGAVSRSSRIFSKSELNTIIPTDFLRLSSLTVCNLDQFLPNISKRSGFVS